MLYLLCVFIGFILGAVLMCIALTKKNLETYYKIQNKVSEEYQKGKDIYNASYNLMMDEGNSENENNVIQSEEGLQSETEAEEVESEGNN